LIAAAPGLTTGTSVGEFQFASLDTPHAVELTSLCLFLIQNGSEIGACGCRSRADFSKALQLAPF